ncbi:hypothetical protein FB45DRAFT_894030 [Roridomyces roridus]|uniref:Uncharacterized protein n=1 Tax=Roridomyces roridus TaxID=1738132 RepID=A0AAD7CG36_9AGAR|nr:hypothetical protein FB45DRAFT_894030 [Roridomyces roridus]
MSPATIQPWPSEVEASIHSQEDADTKEWFKFYKAEEEQLSLWPLHDDPLLMCFKPENKSKVEDCDPKWNEDPPKFSLLWRRDREIPLNIEGPQIPTNLFGRTVAEVFADFPVYYDSPSSSPSLSPPSLPCSPLTFSDEDMTPPSSASSDPSIDEMAEQLTERIVIDSPVLSPLPLPAPDLPSTPDENPMPSLCTPMLTLNSPSSSTSRTLSVGTASTSSSTYAVSPTATGSSGGASPHADLKPRSPVLSVRVVELDEYIDPHPRKRKLGAGEKKTHPCPIPGCTEMFTRRNDATRHAKTAAKHRDTAEQAGGDVILCRYDCGFRHPRVDAVKRHELLEACGKRTGIY